VGPGAESAFAPNNLTPPFTPAQIRKAYGIDQLPGNGAGEIIAIVDAFHSNTAQAELDASSIQYGLPAITLNIAQPSGTPPFNPG
jgi:subtilase family serine protease